MEASNGHSRIIKPGGFLVEVVPDAIAYKDREPGRMSTDTQDFMNDVEDFLDLRRRIKRGPIMPDRG